MAGLLSVGPICSPPLRPHWQLLRVHLSTNPKLPSTSSHLCSHSGPVLTHSMLPGQCPKPDLQMGYGPQCGRTAASLSAGNTDISKPPRQNPAAFVKQSPVSTGGEEELQCCLLQALPCPPPMWTSGTKHIRAAPEQLSPEPGQGRQGEGCCGGFASKVHSLLYQSTTVDISKCWCSKAERTISFQKNRKASYLV